MRALRSATARRLLVYLDVERFAGRTWSRLVDDPLLTTLGIVAAGRHHQRATLRRAAAEITSASNRYVSLALEPGERRGEHRLRAERTSEAPTRIAPKRGSSCDGIGAESPAKKPRDEDPARRESEIQPGAGVGRPEPTRLRTS